MTITFNIIILFIDLIAIYGLRRSKSAVRWAAVLMLALLAEIFIAAALARDRFDLGRLGCYLIFLHGCVLSAGFGIIVWPKRRKTAILSGICAAGLPILAYYVFLLEPYWLDVTYRRITGAKIAAPLKIAVLADLQTENFGDYERAVLRRMMQEKPDLILLAGDYIQAPAEQRRAIVGQVNAFLREIRLSAPYGVFAVQGNVDPPGWPEIFAGSDVTCASARESFDLGPLGLTCLGLADSFNPGVVVNNPYPDKYHLVLGHAPDFAMGRVQADLLVAGHTHGGQVRIPLLGPIITNCRVPRTWAAGSTPLGDGRELLVSRGVGMERDNAPRLRFCCRPELIVVELTPEKK